jgi:superfamily II DNA or RNA helicase
MLANADVRINLRGVDAERLAVMTAFAVGATHRPRTWVYTWLGHLGARGEDGKRFTSDRVRDLIHQLRDDGQIEEHPQRQGFWRLAPAHDNAVLLDVVERPDRDAILLALTRAEGVDSPGRHFSTQDGLVAVLRLELFAGKPLADLKKRWDPHRGWGCDWNRAVDEALMSVAQPALLKRLHASLQCDVVIGRMVRVLTTWQADPLPLSELAAELLHRGDPTGDLRARMVLAEYLLCSGRVAEIDPVVQPLREARGEDDAGYRRLLAQCVDAAILAAGGQWSAAEQAFDAALAALKKDTGQRKGLLPELLLLPYVQSLLAQQSPVHLDKALKLCLSEAGQRRPRPDSPWGVMALAVQMRRGDAPREVRPFEPSPYWGGNWEMPRLDFWRWLMRAWMKQDPAPEVLSKPQRDAADALMAQLREAGLHALRGQCEDALSVLTARPVSPHFFVPAAQESWRVALADLAAIAGSASEKKPDDEGAPGSRIVWVVELKDNGAVLSVEPREQKRGIRGWNRHQAMSLRKLSRAAALAPHDAQVARTIRPSRWGGAGDVEIDAAAAVAALVGHPAVEFADRPGVAVMLVHGKPQIEVVEHASHVLVTVQPPLRNMPDPPYGASAEEQRAAEALAATTVLRDGAQRARVVCMTPAQRRAALLLGAGLPVPKSAMSQLQPVLQGLGAHFDVHADSAAGARDVTAETRLRAELTPLGEGLRLRLVVAPFGPEGPRVSPGHGRSRMIAAVRGEPLAVQRDLDAERRHAVAVFDTCGMLATPIDAAAEFDVTDAHDALALLETLPRLDAVLALDWPAGRAVSVTPVGLGHLSVQVRSEKDWFALAGGVQVDESMVLGLEQLLQWSGGSSGRFVPLGEGRYLALTQELRARIADLATVAEVQRGHAKVPAVAALWLDATLAGCDWAADDKLRSRIDRLLQSGELQLPLPSTLQAELRPYQIDGYQWAMRLSAADCGACLADDMGLGKTLQALAVLLARASQGPGLVAAPTSLIGNWKAEARRFAPSLRVAVYGEGGDREGLLAAAGAHDIVLVSYPLLQLNAESFAAREWHTLVLDEAQALKNAAAKRTQAVQGVTARFRLALSGTPIENRLAELWSIMHICNPGLLARLARFNERFAVPIERDRDRGAQRTLKRLIAPFILRRTKAQVLDDLPPRTELTITVEPEAAERAHYEALRRQAVAAAEASLAQGGGKAQINVLAQLTRLRRAACDPRLVSPELGQAGAKVQAFAELAAELAANGHKALVFSQFVDFLGLLREPLDAAGIAYQYLDGATPGAERTRRVAAFQAGEGALFLISLKAGGFGLNLTVADYVVITDPWWNPAAEDQASGRAHRIGQDRPVTVYRLVNGGTLEERIVELHQRKRELAEGVLEGGEAGTVLDAQVLLELIRG